MEAALKLARQYFVDTKQPNRKYFIARQLSYHGNTLGALAVSHHPARRGPYEVILNQDLARHVSSVYYKRFAKECESEEQYVVRLAKVEDTFQELGPENVIACESIYQLIDSPPILKLYISLVVAEPVSGASQGVTYAPKGYFAAVSAICQRYGALLIWDEFMCGMGRMGTTLHAWQNPNSFTDGIAPDIQAVAKGLGGGYGSIGAVFLNKRIADGVKAGSGYLMHGHTYQAHPLAVAASCAVQDVLAKEKLLERGAQVGAYLEKLLQEKLTGPNTISAPYIFDIRGAGCFWGIEFQIPEEDEKRWFMSNRMGACVQAASMRNGLVTIGMSGGIDGKKGDFVMLAPAYNMTDPQIEEVVARLVKSVEEVLLETVLSQNRS
jgi:adenosylmethionine-8-amino-7-oxononanoate aminotransferase